MMCFWKRKETTNPEREQSKREIEEDDEEQETEELVALDII
jgi:hypothetical protein